MSMTTFNPLSLPVTAAGKRASRMRLSSVPIGPGKLPKLITTANVAAGLDVPRVMAVTIEAHKSYIRTLAVGYDLSKPEAGVYRTSSSATRFAIVVPMSASKASFDASVENNAEMAAAASLTPRPKRSVTIQRLGMQTPSPPRAVQYMATRGGGRFNIMNLPEFHRPAEKRLAVQYTEGEGDVAAVIPKPMHKEYYTRQLFNTNLAPERLSTFKRLVVERTRYLESMDPLKLAVHNNLARIITASRRLQIRTPSVVETSKPISSQRMRRMNSSLAPIDTDAARAYISTGPVTDSPMDSPGPVTPVDETTQISRGSQMERGKTSRTKASKKGGVHQVHSKVKAKARMSRRM